MGVRLGLINGGWPGSSSVAQEQLLSSLLNQREQEMLLSLNMVTTHLRQARRHNRREAISLARLTGALQEDA